MFVLFALKPGGKSKIGYFSDFFLLLLKDEDILQFKVAVGDAFWVEVKYGFGDLAE